MKTLEDKRRERRIDPKDETVRRTFRLPTAMADFLVKKARIRKEPIGAYVRWLIKREMLKDRAAARQGRPT